MVPVAEMLPHKDFVRFYLTAGGRKSCWVSDECQKQDEGVGDHFVVGSSSLQVTLPPAEPPEWFAVKHGDLFAAGAVESQGTFFETT